MTKNLKIHGYSDDASRSGDLSIYGADANEIQGIVKTNPILGQRLSDRLPYIEASVIWACRREMARSVEDVLARRTRALFLNSKAAINMAPRVAELMASELGENEEWQRKQIEAFRALAAKYQISP